MTGTTQSAPRPLRQDAARNRRLLLDTARRVFAEEGLEVGVDTIAAAAGVGTGTFYRRFPSKEDLIEALIDDLADHLLTVARQALARGDGTGLWEFLEAAGAYQADNHGLLCRLWTGARLPRQTEDIRAAIDRLVEDAHRHGTVRAGVTQADIRFVLYGLRGVIETTSATEPDAWRRYLDVVRTGL
jgi:AcrR family transcriptional regulator